MEDIVVPFAFCVCVPNRRPGYRSGEIGARSARRHAALAPGEQQLHAIAIRDVVEHQDHDLAADAATVIEAANMDVVATTAILPEDVVELLETEARFQLKTEFGHGDPGHILNSPIDTPRVGRMRGRRGLRAPCTSRWRLDATDTFVSS
jgi:hypothetical protein